ncbi:MAG: Ig-like domain-containing protein [Fibrobacterales bacterium]
MHWHVKFLLILIFLVLCIGCGSNDVIEPEVVSGVSSAQSDGIGVEPTFKDTLSGFMALHDTVATLDSMIIVLGVIDSLVIVRENYATRLVAEIDAFIQVQDSLKDAGQVELDYQINNGGSVRSQNLARMIMVKADEKLVNLSWLNEIVHTDTFIGKYETASVTPIPVDTTISDNQLSSAQSVSSSIQVVVSSSSDLLSSMVETVVDKDSVVEDSLGNNPPQFTNPDEAFISVKSGSEIIIDMLGSDLDGDSIWGMPVEGRTPSQGTLAFNEGTALYTPHIGFRGEESFAVALSDGRGGVIEKEIVVLILPDHTPKSNALSLDGVDDMVSLPLANIDFTTGITVGMWVKWPDAPGAGAIFEIATIDSTYIGLYSEGTSDNQIRLEINNQNTSNILTSTADAVVPGEWTHLAVVISGTGNVSIYCNGKTWGSKDLIVPRGGAIRSFYMGGSSVYADQFFNGVIDEVILWGNALTQKSVAKSRFEKVSETELLYVPFEESAPLISVIEKVSDTYGALINMEGSEWVSSFTGPETLTVSATDFGAIENEGPYLLLHGQEIDFSAVPNSGNFFDKWVVKKGSLIIPDSANPEIRVSISEATHIEARFYDFITDTVTVEFERDFDKQANNSTLTLLKDSDVTYVRPTAQWYTFYWSNIMLLAGDYKIVCRAAIGSNSDVILRYAYDDVWTSDFRQSGLYKSPKEFQEFDIGSITVNKEGSASFKMTIGSLNLDLDWFKLVKTE